MATLYSDGSLNHMHQLAFLCFSCLNRPSLKYYDTWFRWVCVHVSICNANVFQSFPTSKQEQQRHKLL